ncbi:MAG: hypothetical protein RIS47_2 [Bacteroidota bacterium]|jgi:transaldolase
MKVFVETANLQQIREAQEMGLLDGISTSASLLAQEGIVGYEGMMRHYSTICNDFECDVMADVVANDFEGMIMEGQALSALHYQIVVKIPATRQGVMAIKFLADKGIRTCASLVYSLGQAVWAAKAGASYVAPLVSSVDDVSGNGIALVRQILESFAKYRVNTEVLAGSVRNIKQITNCIEASADGVIVTPELAYALLDNPLTEIGLSKFLDDFNRLN